MNKQAATFFSYVVHPALVPLIGVAIIVFFSPHYTPRPILVTLLIYVFVGTYFFPLLMALLLKKLGLISSLHLGDANERRLPYLSAGLFYFITAQSLRNFPVPETISQFLFAGVIILGIGFMLLSIVKASIHLAGIGALIGLIFYLSNSYYQNMLFALALLFLLSGLVATARLVLHAHKPIEVYLGFFVGIGASIFAFNVY